MKLPDQPAQSPQPLKPVAPQPSRKKTIILWSIAGVLLLGAVIAQAIVRSEINSIKNEANNSTISWQQFTSTADNFTVQFPGEPETEQTSIDVAGHTVPYTMYEKEYDGGNKYLLMGVCTYPPADFDMSDVRARLADALDGAINNTEGASLISSKYIQLDGRTAILGTYSVTQSGYTFDMQYAATLSGNTLYSFAGSDAGDSFTTFINSFAILHS